jgi:multidrug efflux pump subunit AcrB
VSQPLPPVGPSGAIARVFQDSKLTPLLTLISILLGILVLVFTPKEEEPQIDITLADIIVALPGASVTEVESVIATPAEQVMSEIEGVKHVYSVSRQGMAVITVQFKVGVTRQEALVRLYNQVYSNQDWLPADLGATQPLIKPRSIDDVPIMTLTLYDPQQRYAGTELTRMAHMLEVALKRIPGTRDIYTVGGVPDRVDIRFDPALLAGYGLTLDDIALALQSANASSQGLRTTQDSLSVPVQAGQLLQQVDDVRNLVVGMHQGAAVFMRDIAEVSRGETVPDQSVMLGFGPGKADDRPGRVGETYPAVTLAIAKQPGQNAINITTAIEERLELLRNRDGQLIPLASIARIEAAEWPGARYHKDLLPVTYVTADMAGTIDSPLYGMFAMVDRLDQREGAPEQFFIQQPPLPELGTLKWDGEWQITYETFRDMGLAYSVGVFMIFLLLVAQFRSYVLPLVIMAPIPLTLIGILPGHALLGREFTATSMIGMIALAGIIVRNSILLVVFIRQLLDEGTSLEDAVVLAGAVRIKPIALTAISAMVGAYFILNDPIFNGLAISLVFGLAMSTLLTIIVVPLLYYTLARCRWL